MTLDRDAFFKNTVHDVAKLQKLEWDQRVSMRHASENDRVGACTADPSRPNVKHGVVPILLVDIFVFQPQLALCGAGTPQP